LTCFGAFGQHLTVRLASLCCQVQNLRRTRQLLHIRPAVQMVP